VTTGIWRSKSEYKRGSDCDTTSERLMIRKDIYGFHESECAFYEVRRLKDGIVAGGECGGDLEGGYSNEKVELRIVDKILHYRVIAVTQFIPMVNQEETCVSANVAEKIPLGYLNLRAGPGMEFSVKAKLNEGDALKVDAVSGEWKHVTREDQKVSDGWVYGKYITTWDCSKKTSESTDSAKPFVAPVEPGHLPTIGNPNPDECYPKWTGLKRC
jgi:hypothetical protein